VRIMATTTAISAKSQQVQTLQPPQDRNTLGAQQKRTYLIKRRQLAPKISRSATVKVPSLLSRNHSRPVRVMTATVCLMIYFRVKYPKLQPSVSMRKRLTWTTRVSNFYPADSVSHIGVCGESGEPVLHGSCRGCIFRNIMKFSGN
jgi:hypothetical protein